LDPAVAFQALLNGLCGLTSNRMIDRQQKETISEKLHNLPFMNFRERDPRLFLFERKAGTVRI
jgi:hypothetical protein